MRLCCVRVSVGRISGISGRPAVIRLRKKELIVELGNSYVVEYFDGDSERFNYLGAFWLLRVDVVKFICSWPAAWVLKFAR